jgi:asparagine synthase (glutamine-hydrolysing)
MCGIVALLRTDGAPLDPGLLRRATDSLAHRGPDDEGFVLTGPGRPARRFGGPASALPGLDPVAAARAEPGDSIGLGNRRLAILDLTPAGHGPMSSRDGSVWLTYNGEVYNYVELADELEALGHRLESRCDTEVVLAAYLEWGSGCFERLNGMFALAIWDARRAELVLARDPLGIKPLYVAQLDGLFAAASEPKALLALGAASALDEETAYAYLVAAYADGGARTFFRDIRRVEPATVETIAADGTRRVRRYWSLDGVAPFAGTRAEAVQSFRDLFLDAVRIQLRSDVPVGTALSGGLDSSSVVAGVALADGAPAARHTFTAVFPGTGVDESRYAQAVAARHGAAWHSVEPSAEELLADLDALVLAQDEPFPSSSSYAQWRVMRLAHGHGVTVLLDGQGGDELLAGYDGFRPYAIADALRGGRLSAARELRSASLAARTAAALLPPPLSDPLRRRARARAAFVARDLHARHARALGELERTEQTLDGVLRRSLLVTTLPVLLRSEDRNSMAHSREARVPFLDVRLVELAASLPPELKLEGGTTKVVLREALGDLLPPEVLARRDKLGFATPEAVWLRRLGGALVGDVLRSGDGVVDAAGAGALWTRVQAGDDAAAAPLWRVICFERWRRLLA